MANNIWKTFEDNILSHSKLQGLYVIKIPTGARIIPGGRVVKHKTTFDFVVSHDGIASFFDAKCESSQSKFYYSARLLTKKKIHQWNELQSAYDLGSIAGYLIWFPIDNLIGWANVQVVRDSMERGEKCIDPDTKGIVWQKDVTPINLKELMKKDLCEKNHVSV